ncbi:PREDICTED: uncharacterized protein LOC105449292 [Wasmannia auropunctata]|uniref:uncharacterized protein LOC105449292 n=1 Tax=Wasmannia auropunctata TaxID=64793 RepID=UPI0005EFFC04|nr:PREDICTED: uncharacterized protein LOC105449292 [Wasmannia auropunctata]
MEEIGEIEAKIKTWMELIESEKLQDVSKDILLMSSHMRPDSILQLLVHLCRTAEKCDKRNYETGKSIAKLTKILCTVVLSKKLADETFVIAIFKITQCLISFNLYEDAVDICFFLDSDYIRCNIREDFLEKVYYLWNTLTFNTYGTFQIETNAENYSKFKSVLNKEMEVIQIRYKNYTTYLLDKINKNLCSLTDFKYKKYYNNFGQYILECLSKLELYLDENEKYEIYHYIINIICHIINGINMWDASNDDMKTSKYADMGCTVETLNQFFTYFETVLAEDEECYQCFQQFQNFCKTLLVPMKNLTSDNTKSVQNIIYCNLNNAQKYGYTQCLKFNALGNLQVSQLLIKYWNNCAMTDKHMLQHLLDTGILLELMKLFITININKFYRGCEMNCCSTMNNLDDFLKTNIDICYFIVHFPAKTLPVEVCIRAKNILKKSIQSIIIEIEKNERITHWIRLWCICCQLIYKLGILSEHVYEESKCLFSFLCTCIFQLEGFKSIYLNHSKNLEKITSLALHGLTVVHYNNKRYRKAMTACALNVLLTCKQLDTKAFHTWIYIKKNAPKDFANLTMLECLRSKDKIKCELGFSFDTSKYDLSELCSHEEVAPIIDGDDGYEIVLDFERENLCTYFKII